MEGNETSETKSVPLEPFVHQVGGHSAIQQFGKHTVCKPLFSKELKFYQEMPPVLKPFIPEFKGVATVRLKEKYDSDPKLILHPTREIIFEDNPLEFSDSDDEMHNLWGNKRNNADQTTVDTSITDPKPQHYLMLENVISRYNRPSILDLKMGIHPHADYKTSTKEIQQRRIKWQKTTSHTLGVRLVGMKVYHADNGEFLYKSKRDGSKLTVKTFEDTLASFFHNGKTFRCELIDCFVKKLERFLEIMQNHLCSYRFYNSSLLLVYEGDVSEQAEETSEVACGGSCVGASSSLHTDTAQCTRDHTCLDRMDMRMIDFAHVMHKKCANGGTVSNPDRGSIFGVESLLRVLRTIQHRHYDSLCNT